MIDTYLIPEKTVITAKGDGPAIEAGTTGVMLLTLTISKILEQQSLDVSIYGSADGVTWSAKPLVSFPQKFYTGQHPLLFDLSQHGDVKFLRAHWEVNRWGRGPETPMFEVGLQLRDVPAQMLAARG
jgi:hypothetical protein